MADTAALVVALSAQLTKFEKDMKDAVNIADRQTKAIEKKFADLNTGVQNQLSSLAATFGSGVGGGFGGAANVLGKLGPLGATAATSLIALGAAFALVSTEVDKFSKKVGQLRDASDTTGVSITQLNELNKVGLEVGVSAEMVEQSINRMTVAVDQLREGSGPLVETLRKISPSLQQQVAGARSSSEAIDILARAFVNLGSEFERNAFLRALFGRQGFAFGRVLQQVADQGGLKQIEKQARDAGKALDEGIAKEVDDLADSLERIKQETTNIWGSAFAVDVLTAAKTMAEYWRDISQYIADAYRARKDAVTKPTPSLTDTGGLPPAMTQERPPEFRIAPVRTGPEVLSRTKQEQSELAPEPPRPRDLGLEIKNLKDMISALGDAATAQDKYQLEVLETKKAEADGLITREQATDRLNRYELGLRSSTLALKERIGIISEEEFIQKRLIDFYRDTASAMLTVEDRQRAITKIIKEAKKDFQDFQIKQSDLPNLAKFAKEAGDLKANFDKLAVSAFGEFENALADVAVGAATVEQAFKKMADAIIRDLIRITIRMAITAPIANALGGLFGGVGGGGLFGPNPFTGGLGKAAGGPVQAGQPYVVGEKGPELFVPGQSGTIVPNHVSGGRTAAGSVVEINNYVAGETETQQRTLQEGPGNERIVIDIVKKAQARGEFDPVQRARFGLRPNKVR